MHDFASLLPLLRAPIRTRYFPGRLLSAEDFQREQDYAIEKRRLLNRVVLGVGVVCGLDARIAPGSDGARLSVSPGLAIDGLGREIIVPEPAEIDPRPCADRVPARLLLGIAYHEEAVEPVPSFDRPSVGDAEPGLIRETFRLWLVPAEPRTQPFPGPPADALIVLALIRLPGRRVPSTRLTARSIDLSPRQTARCTCPRSLAKGRSRW